MDKTDATTIWLTQEAFDKLQAELDHLVNEGRPDVSQRIAEARDEGDLRENGGYHAAREEQGQMEARIKQLEDMLRRAEVGEAPEDPDEVSAGTRVTIAFDGDADDTEEFLFGSREVLGLDDSVETVYSPQSPLGQAIAGHKVGDSVSYEAPNGKQVAVTIIKVEPFKG